ncbi:hypothetical protein EVAR_65240_1 [Eumeta japonica]|uniref:Uncharacterized protein n=1 Tax=Eumeta variegata TaxID=151549 RepID=A0A4C1ZH96_EUMVA|nr:hypothetical protein EVAR_65240_1 [Eumeta japonica]
MKVRERQRCIRYDRESVFRTHVELIRKICKVHDQRHLSLLTPPQLHLKNFTYCRINSADKPETHTVSDPYPLISAAASYEAPPPYHFIDRPRNAIADLLDALTFAKVTLFSH